VVSRRKRAPSAMEAVSGATERPCPHRIRVVSYRYEDIEGRSTQDAKLYQSGISLKVAKNPNMGSTYTRSPVATMAACIMKLGMSRLHRNRYMSCRASQPRPTRRSCVIIATTTLAMRPRACCTRSARQRRPKWLRPSRSALTRGRRRPVYQRWTWGKSGERKGEALAWGMPIAYVLLPNTYHRPVQGLSHSYQRSLGLYHR